MYRRRWRHVQFVADEFWRRWIKEYLPSLHFRQKWNEAKPNLNVGDVVIIQDDRLPRSCWPLGRVVETFVGKDGLVRSVSVKSQSSVLIRPVHKLCLLESVQGSVEGS